MIKGKNQNFSVEEITNIVSKCESWRDVLTALGYSPDGGGTVKRLQKEFLENNIDTSHFKGQGHTKNIGKHKTPTEKYLNNEIKITAHKLRLRLLEDNIFEYRCSCCGLTEWLGHPIPLELHHKNGNKDDNSLNNLELRCPNCHYFTDTYKTKNWKQEHQIEKSSV